MSAVAISHSRLPLETWDNIIECLCEDRDDNAGTLLACSLTCHALLSASRRHTFFHVCLRDTARYHSFKSLIKGPNYVAPHVRALTVRGTRSSDRELRRFPSNGQWLHLLPTLTRLAHLRLYQFSFLIPRKLKSDVGALVRNLRTLDLTLTSSRAESLASLLRACGDGLSSIIPRSAPRSLEDLSSLLSTQNGADCAIRSIVWNPGGPADAGLSTSLATLTKWLDHGRRSLQKLAIAWIGSKYTPLSLTQKLLRDSENSLEHLHLHFAESRDGHGSSAAFLNLNGNTRLKTLHIVLYVGRLPDVTCMLAAPASSVNMFVNLTYLVIRIVIRRDTFIRMAREWRTFCKEIDGLCSARPLINFEFRLDLRISMHPIVPITQLPEDLRAMMETIAALFVEATSGLASCLPPPERTGGRVRFGIIWLWGGNLPFATAFDKQHCPPEYFLGDPEWYRSNEAPWDFRRA